MSNASKGRRSCGHEYILEAKIEEMLYRPDDKWNVLDYIDHAFRRMEEDIK